MLLLPPSVDKWIPKDHVVRFVWDCVCQMDLFVFHGSYGTEGRPPYDPAMMLAVLIYAYSQGIRSSRKIAKACAEQLPFRWLTGNVVPDHCAIARFRSRHEQAIRKVFVEALRLCAEAGLVNLGKIFLDGTKLKANASLEANRRQTQLNKEVAEILQEAEQTDRDEDQKFGPEGSTDVLPEEVQSPKDRLERLQAAKERLEKEAEAERREQEEKIRVREASVFMLGHNVCNNQAALPAGSATASAAGGLTCSFNWRAIRGSNPGPLVPETNALSTELIALLGASVRHAGMS